MIYRCLMTPVNAGYLIQTNVRSNEIGVIGEEIVVSEESIDSSILIVSKMMLTKEPTAFDLLRFGLDHAATGAAATAWRWRRSRTGRR